MLYKFDNFALIFVTFQIRIPSTYDEKVIWKISRNSLYMNSLVVISMMICNNGMMVVLLK